MIRPKEKHFAFFVTSHGFGHATRASAIIRALHIAIPCRFTVFSTIPPWFWKENLNQCNFQHFQAETDVGLIQNDPFSHDLSKTIQKLSQFLSFESVNYQKCFDKIKALEPDAILCDISPTGLKISKSLGIPSVLIENFSWDWMYETYFTEAPELKALSMRLEKIYSHASIRIHATPCCNPYNAKNIVPPIYREGREKSEDLRKKLRITDKEELILVTTGGIELNYQFVEELKQIKDNTFILTGNFQKVEKIGNLIFMPMQNEYWFPDLIKAAKIVVGKIGYGTLVECWAGKTAMLAIFRKKFRESDTLRSFAQKNMPFHEISESEFTSGQWINKMLEFPKLAEKKAFTTANNGSHEAVKLIKSILSSQ